MVNYKLFTNNNEMSMNITAIKNNQYLKQTIL